MKTTDSSLNDLFSSNKQYYVPIYQRRYIWNETNWQILWSDLCSQVDLRLQGVDKRHFMGAIISNLIETRRLPRYKVIDGQQRLATFQIILCAIRDICQSDGDTVIVHEVNRHILNPERAIVDDTPDTKYKFLPKDVDRESFRSIIDGTQTRNIHHPMSQAYDYFKSQIATYVAGDRERINGLLFSVLNDFTLVQIVIAPSDTVEKIFATINSTGQRLSEFDLIRNDLFLRVESDNHSEALYHRYWSHFEEDAFWNPEIFNQFLRDFLTKKLGYTVEMDNMFDVYVRHYRPTLKAGQDVEYELSELKQYSEVYRKK